MASIPYQRIGGATIGGQSSGGLPTTFNTGDLVKNGLQYAPVGNRPNLYYFDDFLFVTNVNYYAGASTGSIGGAYGGTVPAGAGVGFLAVNTGSTATGGATAVQGYNSMLGTMKAFRGRYGFFLPTLSNATDTYSMTIGASSSGGVLPSRGTCYLQYSSAVNGGRFQILYGPNGSQTTVDTGITVAAGTFYVLDFSVTVTAPNTNTNAGTWAVYTNGVSSATGTMQVNASNAINGGETGVFQAAIQKSAGTTGASVQTDFFEFFGTYS